MSRRRFQDPQPEKLGRAWYIRVWKDVYTDGTRARKRQRIRLADASKGLREVKKLAAAELRKLNSGLVQVGAGVNFMHYVENDYRTKYLSWPVEETEAVLLGTIDVEKLLPRDLESRQL